MEIDDIDLEIEEEHQHLRKLISDIHKNNDFTLLRLFELRMNIICHFLSEERYMVNYVEKDKFFRHMRAHKRIIDVLYSYKTFNPSVLSSIVQMLSTHKNQFDVTAIIDVFDEKR